MRITVKLYAVLQVGRFKEKVLNCSADTSVADIIEELNLPSEHVDILLVNGLHVAAGQLLKEHDVVSLLPMVEGG